MNFEDFNYESFNRYILVDPNKVDDPEPVKSMSPQGPELEEEVQLEMVGFALPDGVRAKKADDGKIDNAAQYLTSKMLDK
jgi:hypothetical protein